MYVGSRSLLTTMTVNAVCTQQLGADDRACASLYKAVIVRKRMRMEKGTDYTR